MEFPPVIRFFVEKVRRFGLENTSQIYYGVYRGLVTNAQDPEKRGRIQAVVETIHGIGPQNAPDVWIDPAFSGAGGGRGTFWPPDEGDSVWVTFDCGDPSFPLMYWGGWFGTDELPAESGMALGYGEEGYPEKRGFRTRAGHTFVVDDEKDKEAIKLVWHKPDAGDASLTDRTKSSDVSKGDFSLFEMDAKGSVTLANKNGSRVQMDAEGGNIVVLDENGNSVTLDKDGIKLIDKDANLISIEKGDITLVCKGNLNITCKSVNMKTAGNFLVDNSVLSAVLGEPLLAWLASHTHNIVLPAPSTPTTPAIPPPPPAILSKNVKLK